MKKDKPKVRHEPFSEWNFKDTYFFNVSGFHLEMLHGFKYKIQIRRRVLLSCQTSTWLGTNGLWVSLSPPWHFVNESRSV